MGYETKLLFVESNRHDKEKNPIGYCSVVATVELSKCGSGPVGDLIEKLRNANRKTKSDLTQVVHEYQKLHDEVYDRSGDYRPEMKELDLKEVKRKADLISKMHLQLGKRLPYVYETDCSTEDFTDSYGDLLLVASLKELHAALLKDQAQIIESNDYDGHGYRRYSLALKLVEEFRGSEQWDDERVKVIMYGH